MKKIMNKRARNKENVLDDKNRKITDVFKVKKCLFDQSEPEFASPTPAASLCRNDSPELCQDDSPFSSFYYRNKKGPFIPTTPLTSQLRSCNMIIAETPEKGSPPLKQTCRNSDVMMESPLSIVKLAVQKAMTDETLIGDFSKPCELPIVEGKHPELKSVSGQTVAELMRTSDPNSYTIVDCRYPYEYEGGHIMSAVNLYHKEEVIRDFFNPIATSTTNGRKEFLIFYCEFSSERAPNMMRFIRSSDRDLNPYPFLYYPELYLIDGGYKSFYADFKEFCEPQGYIPMLDKSYSKELVHYRSLCKNSGVNTQKGKRTKTSSTLGGRI